MPAGIYNLTLSGSGGDGQGDFDISKNMTIIGTGAGSTIINAATLGTRDRIFEVSDGPSIAFKLSRVTLTGGQTTSEGGAILVNNSTTGGVLELWMTECAVVGNAVTAGNGGAILVDPGATAYLTCNVITGNTASGSGGGVFASGSTAAVTYAGVVLDRNVVANNTASAGADLFSGAATGGGVSAGMFVSGGGNLFTSTNGSNLGSGHASDHIGSVSYVVTSAVDSYDNSDNARALSLREAIELANTSAGVQTIWLPAWALVLTKQRTTALAQGDLDATHGDLDVTESLNIRGCGVAGATSVEWRPGVVDAVFDLIGDFNGDGISSGDDGQVSGTDFNIWQQTLGSTTDWRADADDNGIIQAADLDLWSLHFNNFLMLTNIN